MRRSSSFIVAALLLVAVVLIGVRVAAAQSIQWTGHYYVVVAEGAEGGLSAAYGYHDAWNALRPGPDLKGGAFTDFTVRPLLNPPSIIPDHRYDLLAVGTLRGGAVSVGGYEVEGGPYFVDDVQPIADLREPYAVRSVGATYLVVGGRSPEGPVLTGDYVVAYGEHGRWQTAPGPDFRGGTFADLAVGLRAPTSERATPVELLAVGMLNGEAVTVAGTLERGRPVFAMEPRPIPGVARPVAVEWTGDYYVVLGTDADGRAVLVYGRPGAWGESKMVTAEGAAFTGFAVARVALTDPTKMPTKRYDLLAVGRLKGRAVTVPGYELVDLPVFEEGWAEIPGTEASARPAPLALATPAATLGAPSPNPFTHATTLTLALAREQAVVAEVFNALGQRVAVLHEGALAAGPHALTLDGRALAAGTYLLRIRGEDFVQVRALTRAR